MSYWVFTDIFEEAGVPMTPFHGGFGLLNLQGIKKPTFFAYKYLNQLKGEELENADLQSWAFKDKSNINVLLYDMLYPKQGDVSNNDYFIQEFKPQYTQNVSIDINNIEKGKYQLQIFKTGYLHNDAYTQYIRMGRPNQLSVSQENTLNNLTKDDPIENEIIDIKSDNFKYNIEIRENDMVLVKLVKL
jgi:xylan 1,4-beta-xylosidase